MAATIARLTGTMIIPGVSRNGRGYSRPLLARAYDRLVDRIERSAIPGSGIDPVTVYTSHQKAGEDVTREQVGIVDRVTLDETDGRIRYEAAIADTAAGRDVAALTDTSDGRRPFVRGVSIRGGWMGPVTRTELDGVPCDAGPDLDIFGLDLTSTPGVPGAEIATSQPATETTAGEAHDPRLVLESAPDAVIAVLDAPVTVLPGDVVEWLTDVDADGYVDESGDLWVWDALEARYVRTPAGAKRYGLPVGSLILSKAERRKIPGKGQRRGADYVRSALAARARREAKKKTAAPAKPDRSGPDAKFTAAEIVALGGKEWRGRNGTTRVYLNLDDWAPLVGLEIDRYSRGMIRGASLDGVDRLSNNKAAKLATAKVWWQDGKIHTDIGDVADNANLPLSGADLDARLRAGLARKVDASTPPPAPTPDPPKVDTSPTGPGGLAVSRFRAADAAHDEIEDTARSTPTADLRAIDAYHRGLEAEGKNPGEVMRDAVRDELAARDRGTGKAPADLASELLTSRDPGPTVAGLDDATLRGLVDVLALWGKQADGGDSHRLRVAARAALAKRVTAGESAPKEAHPMPDTATPSAAYALPARYHPDGKPRMWLGTPNDAVEAWRALHRPDEVERYTREQVKRARHRTRAALEGSGVTVTPAGHLRTALYTTEDVTVAEMWPGEQLRDGGFSVNLNLGPLCVSVGSHCVDPADLDRLAIAAAAAASDALAQIRDAPLVVGEPAFAGEGGKPAFLDDDDEDEDDAESDDEDEDDAESDEDDSDDDEDEATEAVPPSTTPPAAAGAAHTIQEDTMADNATPAAPAATAVTAEQLAAFLASLRPTEAAPAAAVAPPAPSAAEQRIAQLEAELAAAKAATPTEAAPAPAVAPAIDLAAIMEAARAAAVAAVQADAKASPPDRVGLTATPGAATAAGTTTVEQATVPTLPREGKDLHLCTEAERAEMARVTEMVVMGRRSVVHRGY